MKISLAWMAVAIATATASSRAVVIIDDTFSEPTNTTIVSGTVFGTPITGVVSPDTTNLPGGKYQDISNFNIVVSGGSGVASIGPNIGAAVTVGSYTGPYTISADLSPGTLAGGSDRGVGIGFFATAPQTGITEVIHSGDFTGLMLNNDGGLTLFDNGTQVGDPIAYSPTVPAFSNTGVYHLQYTLTVSGGMDTISNVSLAGSNATYSYTAFTATTVNYAAFIGSGGAFGEVGTADNFVVSATPEPASLSLLGLGGLGLLVRRRRA